MAFAKDTLIDIPNGTSLISNIVTESAVLVWTPDGTQGKTVKFISGSDTGPELTMLYLYYDDRRLIVTPDQPVMLADNTVKPVRSLNPARDGLMGVKGEVILNYGIHIGQYNKGCWNLAFNTGAGKGSFIIANGIVCGDFAVELNLD